MAEGNPSASFYWKKSVALRSQRWQKCVSGALCARTSTLAIKFNIALLWKLCSDRTLRSYALLDNGKGVLHVLAKDQTQQFKLHVAIALESVAKFQTRTGSQVFLMMRIATRGSLASNMLPT